MAAGAPAAAAPAPQDSRSLLYLRSPPPASRAPPPTRSFGPQSDFGAPDDALDSFGARR